MLFFFISGALGYSHRGVFYDTVNTVSTTHSIYVFIERTFTQPHSLFPGARYPLLPNKVYTFCKKRSFSNFPLSFSSFSTYSRQMYAIKRKLVFDDRTRSAVSVKNGQNTVKTTKKYLVRSRKSSEMHFCALHILKKSQISQISLHPRLIHKRFPPPKAARAQTGKGKSGKTGQSKACTDRPSAKTP